MADLLELRPEGLYCPAGDFYIDPGKRVARAVITHAHGDHVRTGMGHYWAAAPAAGLMRERVGKMSAVSLPAYGERFTLGSATVSLHPAGHILGSAQVRVEVGGEVWVASGDYKRCPDPSCAPFEPVPCHTFVTEATFAKPEFVWQPPSVAIKQIYEWWQACKARGEAAVLFCYALGKAQRILAELMAYTDETVLLHNAITPLVKAYRKAGIAMLPTLPVGAPPRGSSFVGRLILAPPGASGTRWMHRFAPYSTGFASGWMQQDGSPRRARYGEGFALSDHADWPGILRSIEECGAQRVLAMHGHTAVLVDYLRQRGIDAAPLSPAAV